MAPTLQRTEYTGSQGEHSGFIALTLTETFEVIYKIMLTFYIDKSVVERIFITISFLIISIIIT